MTPRHVAGLAERIARRRSLERKLRLAWLASAVEEWERDMGDPPTANDLQRIVARYDWSRPEPIDDWSRLDPRS
jgi:hypothetical protein